MLYLFCMKLLFLGGPGTGKSTVGNRLAKDLKWPWISSGAILRESKEQWVIDRLKTAQLFDDEMISELVFVPFDEVMRRLAARGRSQDVPEIIEERQADYERSRNEIVAYLVGNGVKLLTVDGMGGVDEVYKRTVTLIRNEMNNNKIKNT